jgi:hypothetical protein
LADETNTFGVLGDGLNGEEVSQMLILRLYGRYSSLELK